MKTVLILAVALLLLCLVPHTAQACGTCTVDGGGQKLMLASMMALPIAVLFVGFRVIRTVLKRMDTL